MADLIAPLLGRSSTVSPRQKSAGYPNDGLGVVHTGRTLTLLPLVTLIFFEVSGGPFGTEDAVAAAGPLLTILGFVVFPILWSVPEALITAELATAFPENSGYVAWVTAAFGPFWGFQEGLWSWISGVTDNSLYPVMLAANLQLWIPALASGWPRSVFIGGMALLLSLLNFRGLTVVGHTVITSTLAILLPFIVLVAMSVPYIKLENLVQMDLAQVDWPTFLNVMFWNLNYWDNVSTLAGEVKNPGKTFPKALMLAVLLVVLFYLLPTAAALGVLGSAPGDWQLGYYGQVATKVGGPWLAGWVLVAAACSQVGQYQAEMASDSYQLQGMAQRGFLPKVLANRSRFGTPIWGIVLSSMGVLILATMSFVEIVTMLNAIYCMAELLEFAAFIWLRIKYPSLHRPFRVPLPVWGLVLMLLPASALLLVVLALPAWNRDWRTIGTTLGAVAAGVILYPLLGMARKRGWCEFEDFDCGGWRHGTLGELYSAVPSADYGEAISIANEDGADATVDAVDMIGPAARKVADADGASVASVLPDLRPKIDEEDVQPQLHVLGADAGVHVVDHGADASANGTHDSNNKQ